MNQIHNNAEDITAVSIERAVMSLFTEYKKIDDEWKFDTIEELFDLAYEKQVLDSADYLYRTGKCDRRTMARIAHRFLKLVLLEAEDRGKTIDTLSTKILDLSECRTCAGHILQVVHKGIMTTMSDSMFHGREQLEEKELEQIVHRIFYTSERLNVN